MYQNRKSVLFVRRVWMNMKQKSWLQLFNEHDMFRKKLTECNFKRVSNVVFV